MKAFCTMTVTAIAAALFSSFTVNAASVPAAVMKPRLAARGPPLFMYCRFPNFMGATPVDHVTPGRCTAIPNSSFSLGVESVEASASITCNMYRTLDCTGDYLVVEGIVPKLPAAYLDTTQSYMCQYKGPQYEPPTGIDGTDDE